jgi:hypothetical protein
MEENRVHGVCRLCLREAVLLDSHMLPKALYRYLRMATWKNPNPIFMTASRAKQTSEQVHDHLLCATCEDRLNKEGENWVLKHCFRGRGHFPLKEKLLRTEPIQANEESALYAGDSPGVDIEKLVYFAASVFWRAAAHEWWILDHRKRLHLGPYEERFRLFLLAKTDFPARAAITVGVATSDQREHLLLATTPFGKRCKAGFHHYRFAIPGLEFGLFLGRFPNIVTEACAVRSKRRVIFVSTVVDYGIQRQVTRMSRRGNWNFE